MTSTVAIRARLAAGAHLCSGRWGCIMPINRRGPDWGAPYQGRIPPPRCRAARRT